MYDQREAELTKIIDEQEDAAQYLERVSVELRDEIFEKLKRFIMIGEIEQLDHYLAERDVNFAEMLGDSVIDSTNDFESTFLSDVWSILVYRQTHDDSAINDLCNTWIDKMDFPALLRKEIARRDEEIAYDVEID